MPPLLYSKFPYALGFIADFSLCWIGLAGYLSTNTNHTVLTVCLKCGCVLVAQSCPTLCDPMDLQPARLSSVHGILQARILEWVAMSSSRRCFWPRDQAHVSCITGGFFTIWATGKPYDSFFYNWWHHVHTALLWQNFLRYSCILLFIYKNFKINKLISWKIF